MKMSTATIDPVAVENGEWIDNLPDCDDLEILSKGINCVDAKRVMNDKITKLPRKDRIPKIPAPIAERLNLETVAEVCILGWKNLQEDDGSQIPFSRQKVLEIVSDRKYEPIHNAFLVAANRVGDTRKADVEGVAKNLQSA